LLTLPCSRSTRSLPPSSTSPILSVPPEILSHILLRCASGKYKIDKSTYAKLCLVNRHFFFPSREHLYRKLTIFIRSPSGQLDLEKMDEAGKKQYYRDLQILETIKNVNQIAILVKELSLTFENLPPSTSEAFRLHDFLSTLTNLEKFWLLDDGTGFWDPDGLRCDTGQLEIALRIVNMKRMKVLVVPQINFEAQYTQMILSELSNLQVYKGTVFTKLRSDDYLLRSHPTPLPTAKLSRAYITNFGTPADLAYIFQPSFNSLRFLHLVLRLENGRIDLGGLPLLESLTISTRLIDQGKFSLGGPANTEQEAFANMNKTPYILLTNVLRTIESVKHSSSVTSCSVLTELDSFFEERIVSEAFLLALPRSLVELAFGPRHMSNFPWPYLLQNRRLYPALRKIYLTLPTDVDKKTASKALFGVENLEAAEGIQVGWLQNIKDWRKDEDWRVWKQRQFYPEGSNAELMGRVNKLTLEEIKNVTCIVS